MSWLNGNTFSKAISYPGVAYFLWVLLWPALSLFPLRANPTPRRFRWGRYPILQFNVSFSVLLLFLLSWPPKHSTGFPHTWPFVYCWCKWMPIVIHDDRCGLCRWTAWGLASRRTASLLIVLTPRSSDSSNVAWCCIRTALPKERNGLLAKCHISDIWGLFVVLVFVPFIHFCHFVLF